MNTDKTVFGFIIFLWTNYKRLTRLQIIETQKKRCVSLRTSPIWTTPGLLCAAARRLPEGFVVPEAADAFQHRLPHSHCICSRKWSDSQAAPSARTESQTCTECVRLGFPSLQLSLIGPLIIHLVFILQRCGLQFIIMMSFERDWEPGPDSIVTALDDGEGKLTLDDAFFDAAQRFVCKINLDCRNRRVSCQCQNNK